MNNNIVLIGYRGSGKSSTAQALSTLLNLSVFSTDDQLVEKYGDIAAFVKKYGWERFRIEEKKVLKHLPTRNTIIDCGGGIVEDPENRQLLKAQATVVWLMTSPADIISRIGNSRPSLTNLSATEEVEQVLKQRTPLYGELATIEIDTTGKNPQQIAYEIFSHLQPTKICASLTNSTASEMIESVSSVEGQVDVAEIRLDYLSHPTPKDVQMIAESATIPLMFTCRSQSSPSQKLALFGQALTHEVDYIDIDYEEYASMKEQLLPLKRSTTLILSYHNFESTPSHEELQRIYEDIKLLQPDLVKIVTHAKSINDCFTLFSLLKGKHDLIAFCMGIKGVITRILAPKYGSRLTYASIQTGMESAPGQLSLEELQQYNINRITPHSKVFCVIGSHAEQGLSPLIHNAAISDRQLPWVYVPCKVDAEERRQFMKHFSAFDWSGASVTIPHKEQIRINCPSLSSHAQQIGAVNTITAAAKGLQGDNTDWSGACAALEEKTSLENKTVLVLGAGGAAKAVVYGVQQKGATVTVCNRTNEKAQHVATQFQCKFLAVDQLTEQVKNFDIVINATSVGMAPHSHQTLIKRSSLMKSQLIMDLVYTPKNTQLLQDAQAQGCTIITGDRMLLHQAVAQFEHWSGTHAPLQVMDNALQARLQ